MNSYFPLDAIKSRGNLNISGADADKEILRVLESVSRQIDFYTGRHFYSFTQAKKIDGGAGTTLKVPDLIAVTSFKTDEDLDRTYETTWASSDYLLDPEDADPTTRGNVNSRPYYKIVIDVDAGSKSFFPSGKRALEVTGRWGYWEHLRTATETMDVISTTTATAVTVSAKTDLQVGHTIIVDSEQMYLSEATGQNGFTVVRGVNGTTAATHSAAAAIQIYEYPPLVGEACLAQTSRLFRRSSTGYAMASAIEGTGALPGLDRDVKQMIDFYRLWSFA